MNIQNERAELERQCDELETKLNRFRIQADEAMKKTMALLDDAAKEGLKCVSIGVAHKSVPSSMGFAFGPRDSMFAMGYNKQGHPAIWGVAERAGIYAGCGNSDQACIRSENVAEGVYHLRNGHWTRVN